MLILYILLIVYILAINFYAIMLLKTLREESCDENKNNGDGKIILTALLGGAISLYVAMFVTRFKIKNIVLMVLLPVIAVLNVTFFIYAFRAGFTMFVA